jgi:hypothetical protein
MKMLFSHKMKSVDKSKIEYIEYMNVVKPDYHLINHNTLQNSTNKSSAYLNKYNMIDLANSGDNCIPCDR